jgi:predicted nucleotidyltransferase
MARQKDLVPSVRLRLGDLNIKLGVDEKLDALYYELLELKKAKRAGRTVVKRLLTGSILETLAEPSQVEKAKSAAFDILSAFMVDDE